MDRIFIVEDNKMIAKVVSHIITRDLNFECVVAHSLFEAKQVLEHDSEGFLVAILDLNLPDAPDGEVVDYVLTLVYRSLYLLEVIVKKRVNNT